MPTRDVIYEAIPVFDPVKEFENLNVGMASDFWYKAIEFTCQDRPRPAGSKRAVAKNVIAANPKAKYWRNSIQAAFLDAKKEAPFDLIEEGGVGMIYLFVFPRSDSHYGRKNGMRYLKKSAPIFPARRAFGDLTKLVRNTEDGLEGLAFRNDKQVVEVHMMGLYATVDSIPQGCYISIWREKRYLPSS